MSKEEIYEMQEKIGNAQRKFIEAQTETVLAIIDMVKSMKEKEVELFNFEDMAENSYFPIVEISPLNFVAVTKVRVNEHDCLEVLTNKLDTNWKPIENEFYNAVIFPDIERGLQELENADWWFILDIVHEKWVEEIEQDAKGKIKNIFGE